MTPAQIQRNRRMITRLRTDPVLQALISRNVFDVTDVVVLVLDLNDPRRADRHHVTFQWCEAKATGRWRRRIVERVRYARLDKVIFEFEYQADADACDDWLAQRGW